MNLPVLSSRLPYCLAGLTAALAALYLHAVWQSGDVAHLGMSGLFLFSVGILLWEKRENLNFQSRWFDRLIGVGILVALLVSHSLSEASLLRVFPFAAAIGVSLTASGFGGLKQYRQELLILFFLGVPSFIAALLFDLSPVTAAVSAMLLWYLGYDVSLQGVYVSLPGGSIEVFGGCSGIESITYLLGMSIVCLVMFPIDRAKRIWIPILAVAIGFLINAIRVSLMAVLAASQAKDTFTYWHEGNGSLVFGLVSLVIFGACYSRFTSQPQP